MGMEVGRGTLVDGLLTRRVQVARREVELEYSRAQARLAKPSI